MPTTPTDLETRKSSPLDHLSNRTWLSSEVSRKLNTPQRTVQYHLEQGLVNLPSYGRGDRRRFDVSHVLELGIVKVLTEGRMPLDQIKFVMDEARKGTPLTLSEVLSYESPYLIIRFYKSGNLGVSVVSSEVYGERDPAKLASEKRSFDKFWSDTTMPRDPEHIKTIVLDLADIRRDVLKALV